MTRARDLANLIGSGNFTTETLTATAGQTAFTPSNTFTSNFLQVFYNGLLLDPTVDYTENGTTITLTVPATAGDEMEVVTYNTFSVGDAITQTEADNRYVNASGDVMTGDLAIAGKLDAKAAPWVGFSGQVQFGNTGFIANYDDGGNVQTIVGTNAYYDGIAYRSIKSGANVSYMNTVMGEFTFNNAAATSNAGDLLTVVERMKIDSAGRVTMPYQPAIQISAMNVAVGSYSTGGAVFVQSGGMSYNSSTGAITVPVAGNYRVTYAGFSSSANSYVVMSLRKNGAQYGYSECFAVSNSWVYASATQTMIVNMSTSDYIQVYCNGGSPYTAGGGGNSISMELIG